MPEQNLIQRGELQQLLRYQFDIRDRSIAPTLAPDVQPVFIIPDIVGQPVFTRAGWGASVAAVAAKFSACGVLNPTGNAMLLLIDEILVSTAAASILTVTLQDQATMAANFAALSQPPLSLDFRRGILPSGQGWGGQAAVALVAFNTPIAAQGKVGTSGDPFRLWTPGSEITVGPGQAVLVENEIANTALTVSFRWREVPWPR